MPIVTLTFAFDVVVLLCNLLPSISNILFSILSIRDNLVPPTINLDNPSELCDLNYPANQVTESQIKTTISNSFGFGGTNASLVFTQYT